MKYNSKVKTIIAVIYFYSMGRIEGKKEDCHREAEQRSCIVSPAASACHAGRLDISPV